MDTAVSGDGAFFNLSQGGINSDNNTVDTIGSPFAFTNTTVYELAGLPILFLVGDYAGGLDGHFEGEAIALSSITVETIPAVPRPASFPLFAACLALITFASGRRRTSRSAE